MKNVNELELGVCLKWTSKISNDSMEIRNWKIKPFWSNFQFPKIQSQPIFCTFFFCKSDQIKRFIENGIFFPPAVLSRYKPIKNNSMLRQANEFKMCSQVIISITPLIEPNFIIHKFVFIKLTILARVWQQLIEWLLITPFRIEQYVVKNGLKNLSKTR